MIIDCESNFLKSDLGGLIMFDSIRIVLGFHLRLSSTRELNFILDKKLRCYFLG